MFLSPAKLVVIEFPCRGIEMQWLPRLFSPSKLIRCEEARGDFRFLTSPTARDARLRATTSKAGISGRTIHYNL